MSPVIAPPARTTSRKVQVGLVVSDRMSKTIVVQVRRLARHPQFSRVVRRATKFKVHDESNSAKVGDWVKIMETRPLSKQKRWRLVEVLRRASTAPEVRTEEVERPVERHKPAQPAEGTPS